MGLVAGGRAELGWVGLWSSDLSTAGDMMVYDWLWARQGNRIQSLPMPALSTPAPRISLKLPHLAVGGSALTAAHLSC